MTSITSDRHALSAVCWATAANLLFFFCFAHLGVIVCFAAGWQIPWFLAPATLLGALDMFWDGLWYHQTAIYQMAHGWNRHKGEVEIDFKYFREPYAERLRAAGVAFRASRNLHCATPMELMSVPHGYPGVVRACIPEQ